MTRRHCLAVILATSFALPLPSLTLRRLQSEREHRFLLEREEAEALMRLAAGHTRLVTYDRARPVAYARTIYLDTPDRSYYQSSLRGPVRRRIRVREYAGAIDTSAVPVFTSGCFLELKESTGTAREKKRRPITIAEIEQMMADSALQPCLSTWYRRVTLEDAAHKIRITMDEGVVYGAPAPFGQLGEAVPPLD